MKRLPDRNAFKWLWVRPILLSLLAYPALCQEAVQVPEGENQAPVEDLAAAGRIPDAFKEDFQLYLGEELKDVMVECASQAGPDCDVFWLADNLLKTSKELIRTFRKCPFGCDFPRKMCEDWWETWIQDVRMMRDTCAATNSWPSICLTFGRQVEAMTRNESWELPVMCSIIDPGEHRERLPSCDQLVTMTVANRPTLHDEGCRFESRQACIDNLCNVTTQLAWRMVPSNLQEVFEKDRLPEGFVLPGCEPLTKFDFYANREMCARRSDVQGFCDCLCDGMHGIPTRGFAQCPDTIDGYLLFGRLGAENVTLDRECETDVCRIFSERRLAPQCQDMMLPSDHECVAIQLPKVLPNLSACPWRNHSGEPDVLQCLDGYRCNVLNEGWYCCENHRGRARCPSNLPVMCDTLCSGITEYCCRQEGECSARTCPVPIDNLLHYRQDSTTTTATLPPAASDVGADDAFQFGNLPGGWWIWLLTIIPCCAGIVFVFYVRRMNRNLIYDDGTEKIPPTLELKHDKYGQFHAFNPEKRAENADPLKPRICIVMPELPQQRPLGLELLELRVVRVHSWGAQHGWQVGDIIVDIAGHAVQTFEELWEHIQIERNRPPVRFTVERWNVLTTDKEEVAADIGSPKAPGIKKDKGSKAKKSKTLIAAASEFGGAEPPDTYSRFFGDNALPGTAPNWDYEYDEDARYSEYSWDSSMPRAMTAGTDWSRTSEGYVSRFESAFQIIPKKPKTEETQEGSETDKQAEEQKSEGQKEKKKKRVLPEWEAGKSFAQNPVKFERDAWGRSVIVVKEAPKSSFERTDIQQE